MKRKNLVAIIVLGAVGIIVYRMYFKAKESPGVTTAQYSSPSMMTM